MHHSNFCFLDTYEYTLMDSFRHTKFPEIRLRIPFSKSMGLVYIVKSGILLSKGAFLCHKWHSFVRSGIPLSEVAFCCQKWHSFVKSGILLSKVALISFVYSLYKPDENIEFDLDLTTTWVRRHCFIYA